MHETATSEVIKALDKGLMILGVKGDRLPSQAEKMLMVDELISHYKNLSIGEFELAFRLAVRGQLNFDAETYQNFSMLYMSKLIQAYLRWAAVYAFTNEPKIENTMIIEDKITDDEIVETAFMAHKKFKEWRNIVFGLKAFDILYRRNKLVFDAGEIYQETLSALTNHLFSLQTYERNDFRKQMKDENFMENECRKKALAKYFDTIENLP
jgi:hypothetical protein